MIYLSFQIKWPYTFGHRGKSQNSVKFPTHLQSLFIDYRNLHEYFSVEFNHDISGPLDPDGEEGDAFTLPSIREASRLCPSTLSIAPPPGFKTFQRPLDLIICARTHESMKVSTTKSAFKAAKIR